MNNKPSKWGLSEYLRLGAAIAGGVCIVTGIHMAYQGEEMLMTIAQVSLPSSLIFLVVGLILIGVALRRSIKTRSDSPSGKAWYIAIILIAIGLSFLLAYLSWGIKPLTESLQEIKFLVFRDLLVIFLTILAGVGLLVFLVLRGEIEKTVRTDIATEFSKIKGSLHVNTGLMHYYFALTQKGESKHRELDKAIRDTNKALDENLEHIDKIWAKSNLAFYYAVKHQVCKQPQNKDKAIRLAKFASNRYNPYRKAFNEPDWVENYAYVMASFADTKSEKDEVKKFIQGLLSRLDLEAVKNYLKEDLLLLDKTE